MAKYCENCGADLEEGTKFCPECGQEVKIKTVPHTNENKTNKKIIYILIAIIIVFIVLITLSIGGVFNPPDNTINLEKYDFGYVTMMVPEGSEFSEFNSIGKGTAYWSIGYENKLESSELYSVWIGNYATGSSYRVKLIETDGDLEVYTVAYNESYAIQRHVGDYYVQVYGLRDLDTLKEIANSIEVSK